MNKQNYESPFWMVMSLSAEDVIRTSGGGANVETIAKTDREFIMEDIFYGQN